MSESKGLEITAAKERLLIGRYMDWQSAGGPNECHHGYAAGIPCRECDELLVASRRPQEIPEPAQCVIPASEADKAVESGAGEEGGNDYKSLYQDAMEILQRLEDEDHTCQCDDHEEGECCAYAAYDFFCAHCIAGTNLKRLRAREADLAPVEAAVDDVAEFTAWYSHDRAHDLYDQSPRHIAWTAWQARASLSGKEPK